MKENALKNEKSGLWCVVKGVGVAMLIACLGVLVFAFLLRFTSISDELISPVNQVIKGVSIFFGVFLGLKNRKKSGLVIGLAIGISFTICAFLVFSALDGAFVFDQTLLSDVFFASVIGMICGIICVNIKKN